jgi:hypothetical protein
MAKTIWHSELCKLSPLQIRIKSDVLKSKFKGKPDYVVIEVDGEERNYSTENEECADFFNGQKGRKFTIVAEGREAEAVINYVGEPANEPEGDEEETPSRSRPPKKPVGGTKPQERKPERETPPPQRQEQQRPPPKQAEKPEEALARVRRMASRMANLVLVSYAASRYVKEQVKLQFNEELTPEHFQGINATIAIQLSRHDMVDVCPTGLIHVEPKPAPVEKQPDAQ